MRGLVHRFHGISKHLTLKRFLYDSHFFGALYLNNLGLVHSNLHHAKLQRADLLSNYLQPRISFITAHFPRNC